MRRLAPVTLMIVVCFACESRANSGFEQILNGLIHVAGAQHSHGEVISDVKLTPATGETEEVAHEPEEVSYHGSHSHSGYHGHSGYHNFSNNYSSYFGAKCKSCVNPWAGYCCEKRHKKCRQPRCKKPRCKKPRCGWSKCCKWAKSKWGGKSCGCAKKSCGCDEAPCECGEPVASCGCEKSTCGCKKCRKPLFAGCKKWFRSVCDRCKPASCGCGSPMIEHAPMEELQEPMPPEAPPMPEEEQTTKNNRPLRLQLLGSWTKA